MRYRLLEFLPLLLALALVAAWFGFQQPLPWLPQNQQSADQAVQPLALPTRVPPTAVPRATVLQARCEAGQPRFLGTVANLKTRLGGVMGDPSDCEHSVDADGNTQQQTSTGLAYYRRRLNMAAFTNGYDHWALTGGQVLHWVGEDVEPPEDAAPVP
jgi:hypothetical protein